MTRLVRFLLRSSRRSFLVAVATGLTAGLGGVGLLALVTAALGESPPSSRWLAPAFALACVGTVVARVVAQIALIRVAQASIARLVGHFCHRILALPLRDFEERDPGAIFTVLTEDVAVLTAALSGLPLLFVNVTVVLGCFIFLGVISVPVLLCTVVFAVPAIAAQGSLRGRGDALLAKVRAEQETLTGHFRALVEGFKDLKLNRERRDAFLNESIQEAALRVRQGNTTGLSIFAAVGGWGQFLHFGYIGILLFVLPRLFTVPREALAASVLTLLYAVSPLDAVLSFLPLLGRASASMARIDALGMALDTAVGDPAIEPIVEPRLGPLDAPLVLRGVTFSRPAEGAGDGFRLGPIDLTVRPGETLFLVGGNGGGKTTLVKLLIGLYPPDAGTIRHGARSVDAASLASYRRLFTAVFTDGFLFATLPGAPTAQRDARASALLTSLGLDGVVGIYNGAFTTTRLSSGQRKRLALAAACLEDRPILVLDEWASYQDPRFKRVFYREILPLLKAQGKTLVVVSHDEAYFDAADRLIHLSGGAVDGRSDSNIPALPLTTAVAIAATEVVP